MTRSYKKKTYGKKQNSVCKPNSHEACMKKAESKDANVNKVQIGNNRLCKDFLLEDAKGAHLLSSNNKERYQLEKLLGIGGMCEVYEATDLRRLECGDNKPQVAIKRLLPQFVDNIYAQLLLAQEFFILRHITHHGVVRVFDLHREPSGMCLSMELLQGNTMQDLLNTEHQSKNLQGYNAQKKCQIIAEIYNVLSFLHGKGVVHADLKPANIFMTQEERVVLFDFNISQVEDQLGAASTELAQGLKTALKLTAYSQLHVSPERLKGAPPSKMDDVFAASCSIYELLTETHPFHRLLSTQAEEKNIQPQRVEHISARQWNYLKRALSFDPTLRPQAHELYNVFRVTKWYENIFFNKLF